MAGKKATERTVYVPLTLDDMGTAVQADPAEVAKLAPAKLIREPAERTPVMKKFDADVQKMHEFWLAHDKPVPFTDKYPPMKLYVQPDQVPTARFLARKSADFHGFGLHFGKDTPTTDGRVVVNYCVTDKQKRTPKGEKLTGSAGTGNTES